jgi:hypothetical protein
MESWLYELMLNQTNDGKDARQALAQEGSHLLGGQAHRGRGEDRGNVEKVPHEGKDEEIHREPFYGLSDVLKKGIC